MSQYKVSFKDSFYASSENEAYEIFKVYLKQCVDYNDVSAFEFKPLTKTKKKGKNKK